MTDPEASGASAEAAWAALDDGRPDEVLRLAGALPERDPERWQLAAWARLDLGELAAVGDALRRLAALVPAEDPARLALEGEFRLAGWDVAGATDRFRAALRADEDPAVLERLALCADLAGDARAADALLARAARAGGPPEPPRLRPEEFEAAVAEAAEALPEPFRSCFEESAVVIDPMPTRELVRGGEPDGHPPDVLGLFVGLSDADERGPEGRGLPPAIYLFQRNLERACADVETLREEIRVTLYHELGHLLGFDEEGVDALGLG